MAARVVTVTAPRSPRFSSASISRRSSRASRARFGHLVKNLANIKGLPTIQYPEMRRKYSERFRGRHILKTREDGTLKCVACYMCETACPAECIHIEAGEHPVLAYEKYPVEVRDRPAALRLLRLLRGRVPEGRDLDDEGLRAVVLRPQERRPRHPRAHREAVRHRRRTARATATGRTRARAR